MRLEGDPFADRLWRRSLVWSAGGAPAYHWQQSRGGTRYAPIRRASRPPMPEITRPVMFNTPEADRILAALQVFPPDNPWNEDISKPAVPSQLEEAGRIGRGGEEPGLQPGHGVHPGAAGSEARAGQDHGYPDESDPGPLSGPRQRADRGLAARRRAAGEPSSARVRATGTCWSSIPPRGCSSSSTRRRKTAGGWTAAQASIFDLKSNKLRPDGWTSTDAAGLPIFPAVVRFDEVERGMVEHAMRFTIRNSRRAYVYPATHHASSKTDVNLPRMGERFRLRQDFDISGFSPHAQAILKGLKKYGMFVADNGGDWRISVAPDSRIKGLDDLRRVKGKDFEVVQPAAQNRRDGHALHALRFAGHRRPPNCRLSHCESTPAGQSRSRLSLLITGPREFRNRCALPHPLACARRLLGETS